MALAVLACVSHAVLDVLVTQGACVSIHTLAAVTTLHILPENTCVVFRAVRRERGSRGKWLRWRK